MKVKQIWLLVNTAAIRNIQYTSVDQVTCIGTDLNNKLTIQEQTPTRKLYSIGGQTSVFYFWRKNEKN